MSDGRHLTVGSSKPPLTKGKLRLYSMRLCPYAKRVHLALDAKKIPYDVVNINLTEKPEWFKQINPLQRVPALELETGDILLDSLIVAEFVDTLSTDRPLTSQDPLRRAQDKTLIKKFSQFFMVFYKVLTDIYSVNREDLFPPLEIVETELAKRGSFFLSGTQPGFVDYMIWPWIERTDVANILPGDRFSLSEKRFPKFLQWKKLMLEDDAVKKSYIAPTYYVNYIKSQREGKIPAYDMLS